MPGTPGTRSGSGILLPYSSFQYQADGEWRNANQQLLQQPAHPIYITNYLAVGKNNGEWKRVTHRPPVPTSGILLIILASSLKAMQWRNWITQLLAGPAGMVYLILGFQPQPCSNGDGQSYASAAWREDQLPLYY